MVAWKEVSTWDIVNAGMENNVKNTMKIDIGENFIPILCSSFDFYAPKGELLLLMA